MKKIETYRDKRVLVLGLGKSGVAAATLLVRLGAEVIVNDAGEAANETLVELKKLGVTVVTGKHDPALLEGCALLVKNPGIRYDNVMVVRALEMELPVLTEVELAYQVTDNEMIGITGTNGKTTTTTLIAELLKADGQGARLAGNIGFPASEVVQTTKRDDKIVMELSSFQLLGIESFRPHIAVITNIFSTHLDYHGSQEAYEAAKHRIFKNMTADDFLVLNADQEDKFRQLSALTEATVVPFAIGRTVKGAYAQNDEIFWETADGIEKVMDRAQLALPGEHNLENALAAISVAKLSGVSNQAIIEVLSTFAGVKHRLQYLGEVEGRKVYNDSKATNILATQKALSGFDHSRLWLIAGGLDRGNGFEPLAPHLTGLKGLIVMGETADKLRAVADSLRLPVLSADKVDEALKIAFSASEKGDTILLSPACASWDQYPSFEKRGELFMATFEALQKAENTSVERI